MKIPVLYAHEDMSEYMEIKDILIINEYPFTRNECIWGIYQDAICRFRIGWSESQEKIKVFGCAKDEKNFRAFFSMDEMVKAIEYVKEKIKMCHEN